MNLKSILEQLDGEWAGINRLRVMPTDPYRESDSTALVSGAAGGNLLQVAYTWVEQGEPQDGLVVIAAGEAGGTVVAQWMDSWHSSPQWMSLTGAVDVAGVISLQGVYAETWGWRIAIASADGLHITMDNIPPGADPYQVVEANYRRPTGPSLEGVFVAAQDTAATAEYLAINLGLNPPIPTDDGQQLLSGLGTFVAIEPATDIAADGEVTLWLRVPEVESAFATLVASGSTALDIPTGDDEVIATVRTPQGVRLGLISGEAAVA